MSTLLILNDWRLTIVRDGAVRYSEPAVAQELDGGLMFGFEALTNARIRPRQSNLDYIGKMSADPLSQPFANARNHADLVYGHLQQLVALFEELTEPTLTVVHSTTSNEQLSLLLGVAQECGVCISGFTDMACVAVAAAPQDAPVQFLEMTLGSAYQCRIDLDPRTAPGPATEYSDCGINRVVDGWTNVIADQFVNTSRFDPLHAAQTEQQLYNLVGDWFGQATPSSYLTIEHAGETRRQEISIDALRARLQEQLAPAIAKLDAALPVHLGPNASQVPLLQDMLRQKFRVTITDTSDVYRYLDANAAGLIAGEHVQYQRQLTPDNAPAIRARPRSTKAASRLKLRKTDRATHGLHATTAYPIGSADLPESAVGEARCGDTVTVDGRLFTLIEVRET